MAEPTDTTGETTPPTTVDGVLHVEPARWRRRDLYRLLTSLVVPRPIAWVSTLGPDGVANLAPHSYFMVVAADPPHVAFSSTGVKDTLTNVRATGEFVVNIVPRSLAEAMNATSIDLPAEGDEFAWAGLTAAASHVVAAPRVAAAPAHLECRLTQQLEVGDATLVIGEVVHIDVDGDVWADGGVDVTRLDPVGRLAGTAYTSLGEVFHHRRPRWDGER